MMYSGPEDSGGVVQIAILLDVDAQTAVFAVGQGGSYGCWGAVSHTFAAAAADAADDTAEHKMHSEYAVIAAETAAALNAARYNGKVVRMVDFEFAKDKVLMGAERRSMIISESEKKVTAIHESGHALLAVVLPHADPIHKVTIIPRGMALGLTTMLPMDEKHNYSRDYLKDQIAILLGGRIAEEITLGSITTGAGNDLERATEMARKMVCEWGMSDAMGPMTFGKKEEQIFLGKEIAKSQDYSESTAVSIDAEVKKLVSDAYARAKAILVEHKSALNAIADQLMLREVLDAEQVKRLAHGLPIEDPAPAPVVPPPASAEGDGEPKAERPAIVPAIGKPVAQE